MTPQTIAALKEQIEKLRRSKDDWATGPVYNGAIDDVLQVLDRETVSSSSKNWREALDAYERQGETVSPQPEKDHSELIQDLRRSRFFRCSTNGCRTKAPTCEMCRFTERIIAALGSSSPAPATPKE